MTSLTLNVGYAQIHLRTTTVKHKFTLPEAYSLVHCWHIHICWSPLTPSRVNIGFCDYVEFFLYPDFVQPVPCLHLWPYFVTGTQQILSVLHALRSKLGNNSNELRVMNTLFNNVQFQDSVSLYNKVGQACGKLSQWYLSQFVSWLQDDSLWAVWQSILALAIACHQENDK